MYFDVARDELVAVVLTEGHLEMTRSQFLLELVEVRDLLTPTVPVWMFRPIAVALFLAVHLPKV